MNNMIVRINGVIIDPPIHDTEIEQYLTKSINKSKLKHLAITLFTVSCSLYAKVAFAATDAHAKVSIWQSMQPVYHIFSDLAMSLGSLAIIIGLITAIFNKRVGTKIVITTTFAILGCFLVPAAVTLVAIVGHMLNDTLSEAFSHIEYLGR